MTNFFISADSLQKSGHGGGSVCWQEVQALREFDETEPIVLDGRNPEPFKGDDELVGELDKYTMGSAPGICHIYSGSWTKTVEEFKRRHWKVTYTCAAHRISDSKKAHEELGLSYNYPHLTDPTLWKRYSSGYWNSDVLVVPSQHSKNVVIEQMDELKVVSRPIIEVIPHGCEISKESTPQLPKMFTVGYLGAVGGDKGIRYLLEAWKKLNYKDALLVFAGKETTSDWMRYLVSTYGGGSIYLQGWLDNIKDFFSKISLYIQPSATEGYGIPVIESHTHGRTVLCSDHTGAVDLVHDSCKFKASNVDSLVEKIKESRTWDLMARGEKVKEEAKQYSWDKIRRRYVGVWKDLMRS